MASGLVQADEPSLIPDDLKKKFEGLDLSLPTPGEGTTNKAPDESPQYGKYGDATKGGETGAQSSLPADVVKAIWAKIDENEDGRATDREAYAAIKPVRVIANAKDATPLRDAVRKHANTDNAVLVSKAEALGLIAKVRAERCPTAKTAKAYFDRLDGDKSSTLDGKEVQAALAPLGDVGKALFNPVGITVKSMDLNEDNLIDANEVSLSANAMMRVKLAMDGKGIAKRDPGDWLKFVSAVAYLDIDADNQVSILEAVQAAPVGKQFSRIDGNGDMYLTASEFCEFQDSLDLAAYLSQSVGGS